MNEKFFRLPEEKQQAILNAAYRVFSQNSYKNSPMSEIAESAGISKALLFHYFQVFCLYRLKGQLLRLSFLIVPI